MPEEYVPPRVWEWKQHDNPFAAINRPIAGATHGMIVNRAQGPLENQLHERHHSSDFNLRTQDKLDAVEA